MKSKFILTPGAKSDILESLSETMNSMGFVFKDSSYVSEVKDFSSCVKSNSNQMLGVVKKTTGEKIGILNFMRSECDLANGPGKIFWILKLEKGSYEMKGSTISRIVKMINPYVRITAETSGMD